MFGGLGDLAGMMKQAKHLKENMALMQASLAEQRYEAEAGAGMVKIVVNGKAELQDIKIDPKAVEDIELLEDTIKGAMAAAVTKAQEGAKEEMTKITGGMDIPGLKDMLGGGGE